MRKSSSLPLALPRRDREALRTSGVGTVIGVALLGEEGGGVYVYKSDAMNEIVKEKSGSSS